MTRSRKPSRRSLPDRTSRRGNPFMQDRIDIHPTHTLAGFQLRVGKAFPFGATTVPGGINFSVFSRFATHCTLVLFEKGEPEPFAEIPFPDEFRVGNVWTMVVFNLNIELLEYGYRMDGEFDPVVGHRFDTSKVLLDPYARVIGGRDVWGVEPDWSDSYQHRGRLAFDDFDWEHDRAIEIPIQDLVIYEAHVRSLTAHPSAGVRHPGSFAA